MNLFKKVGDYQNFLQRTMGLLGPSYSSWVNSHELRHAGAIFEHFPHNYYAISMQEYQQYEVRGKKELDVIVMFSVLD